MAQAGARDLKTESYWWPLEGVCYHGENIGNMLDSVPVVHSTWGEWKQMHPDTEVIVLLEDPNHSDPRGGHGAEEYWERPGIDTIFVNSLSVGDLDQQLRENAMVMGINLPTGIRAYPCDEIKKDGGVTNDDLGGTPLLAVMGPAPNSICSGAYRRDVGDKVLEFEAQGNRIVDKQTGSTWTSEGLCIAGDLEGTQLEPIHYGLGRWHTWIYPHPKTEIYKSKNEEAQNVTYGIFENIIESFRESLIDLKVEREIVSLSLPLQSDRGLALRIDGEPFLLHHFDTESAAKDYLYFNPHSVSAGRFILQSDPEIYDNIALNTAKMPEEKVKWSKKLEDQKFLRLLHHSAPKEDPGDSYPGFSDIVAGLNERGIDCSPGAPELHADITFWYPCGTPVGLRPGVENWFTVTIDTKDPFEIHRFRTIEGAKEFAASKPHATFQIGRYVFYSTPVNMFLLPRFRMVDRPKEKVNWSDLLEDEEFKEILREIIEK